MTEPAPTPSASPPEAFLATLHALTPRAWVVPTIVAANVAVFVAMAASGVHLLEPTAEGLLDWGANFGPLTTGGSWWRLLSCTFVHIGVFHLLLNLWALWDAGRLVERLVGNTEFLVLYLASGVAGSIASVAWNPMVVSAGASGAIFGVYGALLGILARHRASIPVAILSRLARSTLVFVGYNLVFGLLQKGIDMAAHLGGLGFGFACGLALSQALDPAARRRRLWRALVVAAGAGAVLAGAILAVPRAGGEFRLAVEEFARAEKRAIEAYNDGVKRMQAGTMRRSEMSDLLEREIVPAWRAARARIAELGGLPPALEERRRGLLRYATLRLEAWEMLAPALKSDDLPRVLEAMRKNQEAEKVLKELGAKREPR